MHLSPLPCWKHLPDELYHKRMTELVRQIEETTVMQRQETGAPVLGAGGVTEQDPETRPQQLKKSPAPLFHTFRKSARKALYEAYAWFVAAYREAAGSEAPIRRPKCAIAGRQLPAPAALRSGLKRGCALADRDETVRWADHCP